MKFSSHANSIREWIRYELLHFKSKGDTTGGYGAAAKGMVLLHYMIGQHNNGSSYLDFVLDDMDFFDEIAKKIVSVLKESSHKGVTFLVPFPEPRVIYIDLTESEIRHQLLRKLPHYPTPIPNPITNDENRTKTLLVTHQRNEEVLMPFIMNHASMFDKVIRIDYESDDHTLDIIERFAPPSWEIVNSTTGKTFDAAKCDEQVMFNEKRHPRHWHLGSTTTEFLVTPNLRQTLSSMTKDEIEKARSFVKEIPFILINGNNTAPLLYSRPLPSQCFVGNRKSKLYGKLNRYLHYNTENTHAYSPGRHEYKKITRANKPTDVVMDAVIMKFDHAPWPEVKKGK
jgi:hypothetical protein